MWAHGGGGGHAARRSTDGPPGLSRAVPRFAEEMTSMDGQRFDALTRLLTRGLSRRGTLKTFAGVAVAGVSSRIAGREAEADTGTGCVEHGLACSPGECCHGLACRAGFGSGGQKVCGACLKGDEYCAPGECCSGSCTSKWWLGGAMTCDGDSVACEGNGCHKKKKKKKHGKKGKRRRG
jgi:hypothetical protein